MDMELAKKTYKDPALGFRFFVPSLPYGIPAQFVKSVTCPFYNIATVDHNIASMSWFFPGTRDLADLEITFNEDSDYKTTTGVEDWRKEICDDELNYGLPVTYLKDINIFVLDVAKPKVLKVLQYGSVWPLGVPAHEYDVGESTQLTTAVTFKCRSLKVINVGGGH